MKTGLIAIFLNLFFIGLEGSWAQSHFIGLQLGANQTPVVAGYGGSQPSYGLHFTHVRSSGIYWKALLETNRLGNGDIQVKKERVSWMAILGFQQSTFYSELGLGAVDTLSTYYFDPDRTIVDPFTGTTLSSDTSGLKHEVEGGYRIGLGAILSESTFGRFKIEAAYTDIFKKTAYKGAIGLLLVYDLQIPN